MTQGFTNNWEALKAWLEQYFGDHGGLTGLADDDHLQYMPRSGVRPMTGTLDLDDNELDNVDGIQFGLTPASGHAEGLLHWSSDDGTLEVGLPNGVELQIGQEIHTLIKNQTGADLVDGKAIKYDGSVGASGRMKGAYGIADGTDVGRLFIGISTETIADAADGLVTAFGKVRGIETDGSSYSETWVEGDIL